MAENGVRQWLVTDAEAGQRLDNFLLRVMTGVPRSHIYKILRSGEVRVNKGRARPHYHIAVGDVLRLPPVRVAEPSDPAVLPAHLRGQLESAVLFEDSHVLVLNKPSGLAVHGGSGLSWGIIEALRQLRPEARELELVHRLDRDTSGCLVLSKKRSALRALHEALRQGQMEKQYLALTLGDWKDKTRSVRLALRKNTLQSGERMVRVDPVDGKPAHTRFLLLEHFPGAALLQADLDTGRTHQIRVHLQAIEHPVAGDEKYGDAAFNQRMRSLGLRRLFLHAVSIRFTHPRDQQPMHIQAPLPTELEGLLQQLRQEPKS